MTTPRPEDYPVAGPKEPQLEMRDGSFLMWAVLSLALLNKKVTNRPENDPERALRETLDTIGMFFGDANDEEVWSDISWPFANHKMERLKINAIHAAQVRGRLVDDDFAYLYAILQTFNRTTQEWVISSNTDDEVGQEGMLDALTRKMENDIIGEAMEAFLSDLRSLPSRNDAGFLRELFFVLDRHVRMLCTEICVFAMQQADVTPEGCEPRWHVGHEFAELFEPDLCDHLEVELRILIRDLGVTEGLPLDFDENVVKEKIGAFIRRVAWFFSYASPLLYCFQSNYIPEESDEEDRFQEYEPADLVDVLAGPDNVSVDEVSSVVATLDDSQCGICFEAHKVMRKTNVCGHEFGEECLAIQLSTYMPNRYKCSSCRAKLLQS